MMMTVTIEVDGTVVLLRSFNHGVINTIDVILSIALVLRTKYYYQHSIGVVTAAKTSASSGYLSNYYLLRWHSNPRIFGVNDV